ncbi:MAG: glycosyltransferase family 2 protein [Gammaproteobacteria bacterium]
MTLLVRDEEDIIGENIDFHRSQGVDLFIVTDNKSVDATPAILKEYEKKGFLFYLHEPDDNYDQHRWVTRMARMAYTEFGADWVINNDADEFWWPQSGNLKRTFENIPAEYNLVEAQRHNFVPVYSDGSPFYLLMKYRFKISLNHLGNPLPAKVAHRGKADIKVNQGNHGVENIEQRTCTEGVEIFHFPMRSLNQFENKIAKGGAAYERNPGLSNVGQTWKKLFKEFQETGSLKQYFDSHFYDDDKIERELHSGIIVEDVRLANFLSEYYSKR